MAAIFKKEGHLDLVWEHLSLQRARELYHHRECVTDIAPCHNRTLAGLALELHVLQTHLQMVTPGYWALLRYRNVYTILSLLHFSTGPHYISLGPTLAPVLDYRYTPSCLPHICVFIYSSSEWQTQGRERSRNGQGWIMRVLAGSTVKGRMALEVAPNPIISTTRILCVSVFACVYVCAPCACLIPSEARKRQQMSWRCSHRWLWATM